MARIRSVHPGLFTDEAFVSLSADAQVFLIGLWTEADDQGIFEWKPVTLRMRLRPSKDGSVEPILAELTNADCVRLFQLAGRNYGAIRNFRKYQRPKSPNAVHPITDEIRIYVSLSPVISEIGGDEQPSFPPKGEIDPQMEDGGKEEGGKYKFSGKVVRLKAKDFDAWLKAYHSIPDLSAELQRIDAGLAAKPPDNWFVAASAMLNAKHQKLLGERRTRPAGGVIPFGVGG